MIKVVLHIILLSILFNPDPIYYKSREAIVEFTSSAPLEKIKANSKELKGIVDLTTNTFTFSVPLRSFSGFNSDLQREHFNENYVESTLFPNASFKGKIIEQFDFDKKGKYSIRAKGDFFIHGVSNNLVIPCNIEVQDENNIVVQTSFKLNVSQFNIGIPKIVNQKVSPDVSISLKCNMRKFSS